MIDYYDDDPNKPLPVRCAEEYASYIANSIHLPSQSIKRAYLDGWMACYVHVSYGIEKVLAELGEDGMQFKMHYPEGE